MVFEPYFDKHPKKNIKGIYCSLQCSKHVRKSVLFWIFLFYVLGDCLTTYAAVWHLGLQEGNPGLAFLNNKNPYEWFTALIAKVSIFTATYLFVKTGGLERDKVWLPFMLYIVALGLDVTLYNTLLILSVI